MAVQTGAIQGRATTKGNFFVYRLVETKIRIAWVAIAALAGLGAFDFIVESIEIFCAALRKRRDKK